MASPPRSWRLPVFWVELLLCFIGIGVFVNTAGTIAVIVGELLLPVLTVGLLLLHCDANLDIDWEEVTDTHYHSGRH